MCVFNRVLKIHRTPNACLFIFMCRGWQVVDVTPFVILSSRPHQFETAKHFFSLLPLDILFKAVCLISKFLVTLLRAKYKLICIINILFSLDIFLFFHFSITVLLVQQMHGVFVAFGRSALKRQIRKKIMI